MRVPGQVPSGWRRHPCGANEPSSCSVYCFSRGRPAYSTLGHRHDWRVGGSGGCCIHVEKSCRQHVPEAGAGCLVEVWWREVLIAHVWWGDGRGDYCSGGTRVIFVTAGFLSRHRAADGLKPLPLEELSLTVTRWKSLLVVPLF